MEEEKSLANSLSDDELSEAILNMINALREEKQLTQKQIATLIGRSEPVLTRSKSRQSYYKKSVNIEVKRDIYSKLTHLNNPPTPALSVIENDKEVVMDLHLYKDQKQVVFDLYKKELPQTMAMAGVFCGMICSTITVLSKETFGGYWNIRWEDLVTIVPLLFIYWTFHLGLLCWFCGETVLKINQQPQKRLRYLIYLSILSFIITVVFRGIKARDSYLVAGFESGNGLLGEPDFEIIGTALAASICSISVVKLLLNKHTKILIIGIVLTSIRISLLTAFAFATIYFLFSSMIYFGIIIKSDYLLSSAVFNFEFPHPERILMIAISGFIIPFFISLFVNAKSEHQD